MNNFLDDEDEDDCNLYTNSVARLKALKNQAISITEEADDAKTEDIIAVCMGIPNIEAEPIVGRTTRSMSRKAAKKSCKTKKSKKSKSKKDNQCPSVDPDVEIVSLLDNDDEFNKPQNRVNPVINLTEDNEDDVIVVCNDSDSGDENYDMDIKVLWKSKTFHRITIRRHENFQKVFEHFAKLENVPVDQILITKKDKTIRHTDTPASIRLSIIDILEGGVVNPDAVIQTKPEEKNEDLCSIKVQTADKRSLVIQLKMKEHLKKLITSCAEQLNVKEANIKLYFDGEQVNETDTPETLEFEKEACIDLRISRR